MTSTVHVAVQNSIGGKMSDLIRREDAINALVNLTCYGIEEMRNLCESSVADSEGWLGGIRDAVDEIEALPSAEPERKTGKWIEHKMLSRDYAKIYYQHDCCCELYESPYRFCPYCGAEMKLS